MFCVAISFASLALARYAGGMFSRAIDLSSRFLMLIQIKRTEEISPGKVIKNVAMNTDIARPQMSV